MAISSIKMPSPDGAAPFQPPTLAGKPEIAPWVPPAATNEQHDFAELHTIDLSLLDSSDSQVVAKLVKTTKEAIKKDGFLYLVNYGVTIEQASLLPEAQQLISV